jgi:hypothetical protein
MNLKQYIVLWKREDINNRFSVGTEITAIDHHPINQLRKELFRYIPSDGRGESGKYAEMNDCHLCTPILLENNHIRPNRRSLHLPQHRHRQISK